MTSASFPWLTATILLPALAAAFIPCLPNKTGKTVRLYSLGVALANLAIAAYAFFSHYDAAIAQFQLRETYPWIPQLGLNWSVAADGLSMPLILLASLITTLAILAAWPVTHKPRLFYALVLLLYSAQIGVFAAKDLLLFFLMWEIELVPVYLLIAIWGGQKRLYAATKFILYTALASLPILIGGLALAFSGDRLTFDFEQLALKDYPSTLATLTYLGFLLAFGVKLAVFPLHTWLPDAHGEASAPISMILAGVLLKMGGYGLIRFNLELLPDAHASFAPLLVVLGAVNIIYGAFAAFGQTNLKRRLAYSSISHMGFVLVGIAAFTEVGLNGALLQMLSHGLIAAALFFLAGVAYERTHTLMMDEMGGLAQVMPRVFALFTTAALASLALPGMSGFVSELTVFLGLATSDAYATSFKIVTVLLSAVGLILTPIYLLSMLRTIFYGKLSLNLKLDDWGMDAKPREVFIAASLLLPIIGIGLYPKLATAAYDPKTVEVALKAREALPIVAAQAKESRVAEGRPWSAPVLTAPPLPATTAPPVGLE